MSDGRLAEIRALFQGATPGPWECWQDEICQKGDGDTVVRADSDVDLVWSDSNRAFLVASITVVSELLQEIDRLRERK